VLKLTESQRSFLKEAMIRYHSTLEGSPAAEYLEMRGLAPGRTDKFRLGYVGDPLPGHEMFKGFLAVPYLRKSQEDDWSVVSIRFRCVQDHDHKGHGKYMTAAGDRPRLYNTPALLRDTATIAVCEGELDAITAQLCGVPAVGVPGAQAWQPHFREPFLGYREVLVLTDGDEAGMAFGNTVASTLPNAKIIPMPPGEDVNSLVSVKGMDALLERMR
jgi:DNA primase